MHYSVKIKLSIVIILIIFVLFGCKDDSKTLSDAPKNVNCTVQASNTGSEKSQLITIKITFDRVISVEKSTISDLKILIGGIKIKNSICTIVNDKNDNHTAIIKIPVEGITDGKMTISSSKSNNRVDDITNETGTAAAYFKETHCLIPSGVKLETIETLPGTAESKTKITKKVTDTWKVRGIAWILFLENGKPASSSKNKSVQLLKGAIPVHGHDFSSFNNDATALSIASSLKEYYGDRYNFTSNGSCFTIETKTPGNNTTIDVQVLSTLTN